MRFVIWFIIITLSVLALFGAMAAWSVFHKERIVKNELTRTSQNLTDLKERQSALQAILSSLDTDRGVENEVRKRFPLTKSGEEVIVLLDAKDDPNTAPAEKKTGLWSFILGWFKR